MMRTGRLLSLVSMTTVITDNTDDRLMMTFSHITSPYWRLYKVKCTQQFIIKLTATEKTL